MSDGLFLYFLPATEADEITRDGIASGPLSLAFSDALRTPRTFTEMTIRTNVTKGPSGSSGTIIAVHSLKWASTHQVGYYPEKQTWRDCGTFWLGYANDAKPGPDSLQRDQIVTGYEQELGDDRIWVAPIVRYPAGNTNLPQSMGIDGAGQFVESVVSSMQWAWALACDVWDRYVMGDGLQRDEIFGMSVKCLAINYRLGPHEATALGLIDGPKAKEILQAAIAGPMIDDMMSEEAKKNQTVDT